MWQYFLQGRAWATGGHYYPILQTRKLGWGGKWPRTISDPDREVRTAEGACPQASGSFPRIYLSSRVWPPLQPILPHRLRVRPRGGRGHGQCWDWWGNLRPEPKDTPLLGQADKGPVPIIPSAAGRGESSIRHGHKNFSDLIKISLQLLKRHDSGLDQWRKYDHH